MIVSLLLILVPLSVVLAFWLPVAPIWIFVVSGAAIIPVANWMRVATDHLARRTGPAVGGLVNVAFGSVAELILALFVLRSGNTEVVKAQIIGSVIGTSLLGLGVAIVAGGISRRKQTFNRESAGTLGSLLILSLVALLLPAFFDYTERHLFTATNTGVLDERLSVSVSLVLIMLYGANLVYTLVTRRDIFQPPDSANPAGWPLWKSLAVLLGGTAVVALESYLVSENIQATAERLTLSPMFLGIIVLALIGNIADIIAAVYFAREDRMGLVMGLCLGSSIQVALVLAPTLVLISHFMQHPMNLIISNPLELIALVGAVFSVRSIAADGETNWFEGVLLIGVYALFGIAFFFAGRAT